MSNRKADLSPPLGLYGGPCLVADRIEDSIQSPRVRENLIDKVEQGEKLTNPEASIIYKIHTERGMGVVRQMRITPHAQYRMDQRGVTVGDLQIALRNFSQALQKWKSTQDPRAKDALAALEGRHVFTWVDQKLGALSVSFIGAAPGVVNIVTTFWEGLDDPRPTSCNMRTAEVRMQPLRRQRRQRGQDRIRQRRWYMQNKNKVKQRARARYKRLRNNVQFKRQQQVRRQHPDRFKRRLASSPFSLPFVWEGDHTFCPHAVVGAEDGLVTCMEGDATQTYPLQAFLRRATFLEEPDIERFFDILDGSLDVHPSRVAYTIPQILSGSPPDVHARAQGLSVQAASQDGPVLEFRVQGSTDNYMVLVERTSSEDVRVSCSCNFWQWQGPEYWAHTRGYLYGAARSDLSFPDVRDPQGNNGACKHVIAVLKTLET